MSCTEAEESVGNDLTATKTQIKHINKDTNSVSDKVERYIIWYLRRIRRQKERRRKLLFSEGGYIVSSSTICWLIWRIQHRRSSLGHVLQSAPPSVVVCLYLLLWSFPSPVQTSPLRLHHSRHRQWAISQWVISQWAELGLGCCKWGPALGGAKKNIIHFLIDHGILQKIDFLDFIEKGNNLHICFC